MTVEAPRTILHLSDIHRTDDEPVTNDEILHPLKADIQRLIAGGVIARPDVVVVSGDLTQRANATEFQEAERFLRELLEFLSLPVDRLVIVPGNHDIDWESCERNFQLRGRRPASSERLCVPFHERFLVCSSEASYEERLDGYRRLHESLYNEAYSVEPAQQFFLRRFEDLGLAFVGYNSCHRVDHARFRGEICHSAIANGAKAVEGFNGIKFAVWHHDLDWRSEQAPDSLSVHSLRFLSEREFHMGLCGHSHRPASNDSAHMDSIPMPVIAAGSLCAGERQRRESIGRSYQILTCTNEHASVHVRTKETVSSPWKAQAFELEGSLRDHYTVKFAKRGQSVAPLAHRRIGTVRVPSPFAANSARDADPGDVLEQYVWTPIADRLDAETPPQIVLGPRGSGKTALLLSLTLKGRFLSPNYRAVGAPGLLDRVGLLCAMNVDEVTSFNGKGWLEKDDRKDVFLLTVVCIAAQQLVCAVRDASAWRDISTCDVPQENEVCRALASLWFASDEPAFKYMELLDRLSTMKAKAARILRTRDVVARNKMFDECAAHPIYGGWSAIVNAANKLAGWKIYEKTKWWLLFDEVEYLNEWQQDVVYGALSQRVPRFGVKLATLPYAHYKALERITPQLSPIHDFEEVVLQFAVDRTLGDDAGSREFANLARSLWANRLRGAGFPHVELEHVWPTVPFEDVVRRYVPGVASERILLETLLIGELSPDVQARAYMLRDSEPTKFGNEIWRRYAQPFRYRLAAKWAADGLVLPLVWGVDQLLKACDGNCRWFLQLADECYARFWASRGLLPLEPDEQYSALRSISEAVYGTCGSMTEHGGILKNVVDTITSDLRSRITEHRYLVEEALNAEVQLLPAQADAVAVGIAFGYVVPQFDEDLQGRPVYPRKDAVLRLGFPIAVRGKLPLRAGGLVSVDLQQARLPWLKT